VSPAPTTSRRAITCFIETGTSTGVKLGGGRVQQAPTSGRPVSRIVRAIAQSDSDAIDHSSLILVVLFLAPVPSFATSLSLQSNRVSNLEAAGLFRRLPETSNRDPAYVHFDRTIFNVRLPSLRSGVFDILSSTCLLDSGTHVRCRPSTCKRWKGTLAENGPRRRGYQGL